jgi:hypothetical protein
MSERQKPDIARAPPRRSGGRPRLGDDHRRTGRISVPVSREEEDVIESRGRAVHMKKSVFLRHLGLGKRIRRPVPAINYRAYRQLGRLAADFHYVLTLMESGQRVGIDRQLAERILNTLRHVEELLVKDR